MIKKIGSRFNSKIQKDEEWSLDKRGKEEREVMGH